MTADGFLAGHVIGVGQGVRVSFRKSGSEALIDVEPDAAKGDVELVLLNRRLGMRCDPDPAVHEACSRSFLSSCTTRLDLLPHEIALQPDETHVRLRVRARSTVAGASLQLHRVRLIQ